MPMPEVGRSVAVSRASAERRGGPLAGRAGRRSGGGPGREVRRPDGRARHGRPDQVDVDNLLSQCVKIVIGWQRYMPGGFLTRMSRVRVGGVLNN